LGPEHSSSSPSIIAVRGAIDDAFARLDALCTRPDSYLHYRPAYPGAWTAFEHMEHVSLANHFLLLTIGKGVRAALRRAQTQTIPEGESALDSLLPIGDPDAFPWEPPEHMIPSGVKTVSEVQAQLALQYRKCLEFLDVMEKGEGKLCSYRMSVHCLGKLDMYQWIYFLTRHASWHLEFLARRKETD
jgi:DinB family protein